jgi:sec-independent protein translocase protein TatA
MTFGGIEWVIVLGIALLLFGPKQLPKLGKMIGSTMRNVREGMDTLDPSKPLPEEKTVKAKAKAAAEDESDTESADEAEEE